MASRRDARRTALDILYQADASSADPVDVLAEWAGVGRKIDPFTEELVRGVAAHLADIDAVIGAHAEGWTVPRLASVDRTILRLACEELLHRTDVPPGAAINEAVEAAKELSTEESGRFVNGILGQIARETSEGEGRSGA